MVICKIQNLSSTCKGQYLFQVFLYIGPQLTVGITVYSVACKFLRRTMQTKNTHPLINHCQYLVKLLVNLMWLHFFVSVCLSESYFQCGQLLQDQEPVQRWHVSCGEVYQQAQMVSRPTPLAQIVYLKVNAMCFTWHTV